MCLTVRSQSICRSSASGKNKRMGTSDSAHQLLGACARIYGPRLQAYMGGLLLSTVIKNKPFNIYIIPIVYTVDPMNIYIYNYTKMQADIIYPAVGTQTIENCLIHLTARSRRKESATAYLAAGYTTLILVLA